MTFLKSGVKKSRCTQLSVGLATLFVTSTFLFGGESVQADSVARGDDYPLHYKNGSIEIDQWRMYSRQCTSFAAFRLSSVNGFEIPPAYGNANEWGHRARREGYRVDTKPEVGAIAWSTEGYYGHVAWVSEVSGDMIEIEEYNYGVREKYNRRKVKASTMTGFIHFKDVVGGYGGSGGSGSSELPFGGHHLFTQKVAIRNLPSMDSVVIDYYYPGEGVTYDQVVEKNGSKWLSYIARSGNRRYIQHTDTIVSENGWKQQGKIWNYRENGVLVVGWKKINGSWYHFKENGSMSIGWVKDKGIWYYLKKSGEMQTGWLKDSGIWYYLESSGAMKSSQWFQVGGKYYYVNASGALAVNTTVDGYRVNQDGERI
ncbi:Choline binding protein D [Streptococcus oralis]|uniref:N-acetylmuramoyl-L-alanine amidase n=1 Tax=Streptococcus oralis TaxID=1303 RepID=A0A139RNR8_STROR|nr:CHAP domain-containing protein [Streptococcus oralis]KXU16381.1 Choline binding protein D [Streptococcus oralis]